MNKYIAGAVLSIGLLASPLFASASGLTNSQIQSILSLLSAFGADAKTISNVTVALNGGTPSTSNSLFCHTWNRDLTVGNSGDDVAALDSALTISGVVRLPMAHDDYNITPSKFTERIAGDVVYFQKRYGIRQTGYVGPLTRAKLNALYGCRGNGNDGTVSINQTNTYTPPKTNPPPSNTSGLIIDSLTWGPDFTYGTGKYIYTITGKNFSNVVAVKENHQADGETKYTNFVVKSDTKIVIATGAIAGHNTTDYYTSYIQVLDSAGHESAALVIPVDYRDTTTVSTSPKITDIHFVATGNPAAGANQMVIVGENLDKGILMNVNNGCTQISLDSYGLQQYLTKSSGMITIHNPVEFINNNTNFDSGRGLTTLNCINYNGGTTVSLTTFDNKTGNTYTVNNFPQLPDPVIESFYINDSEQFSISAKNFSTITFKADCGSFVHIYNAYGATSSAYPTGSQSLCNAEQLYHNSATNSSQVITNQPMVLWATSGGVSYVGNGPATNKDGSVTITAKACNTAGVCVQKSATFTVHARG